MDKEDELFTGRKYETVLMLAWNPNDNKVLFKIDDTLLVCTEEANAAFSQRKLALVATTLTFHDPYAQLALVVDASDVAAGTAFYQKSSEDWKPLGFFSCKFNDQ